MNLTTEQIMEVQKKIEEAQQQRDRLIADANLQVAFVDGRIKQLEDLLTGEITEKGVQTK